ncbi:uncharacterized protein LOC124813624 [Hydra vulgaris]|uniref:uncharacterized protein LOC124813624 n=1 Tax=Hydra vulgaris TaxID=6087 RepID=UPI001F5E9240|nr:uncharacterized protein LOC124813624 [Hydra vulgaris]
MAGVSMSTASFQRNATCCCCWEFFGARSLPLSPVNSTIENLMKLYIYPGYSLEISSYPTVVCSSCRRNLYMIKSGNTPRGSWGEKVSKVEWKMLTRNSNGMLPISETEPVISFSANNSKLCGQCYSILSAGHVHNCSSSTAVKNLIFLSTSLGSIQAEQVASGIIQNKMSADCISTGTTFSLSTGGNPLNVTVGCPSNKVNRRSVKQVSLQVIKELQVVLELSNKKTKQLISTLRKGIGSKTVVETNIFGKLNDLSESISHFYHVEKIDFLDNELGIVEKDLVYVQESSSFTMDLINQRGLDVHSAFVRISMDSGGSFLKIIINVFDVNEKKKFSVMYMNSGVQILAIVEDVPESNHNLIIILEKLRLQDVNFFVAFDLKCANAVFGLSSHAGKRACLWCEGLKNGECGKLRTLGSLDYWYEKYSVENKFKKSNMQQYMNVIHPRILYLEKSPDTLIQHLVPPPELHLLIGVVSTLGCLLMDIWPEFDDWLKTKSVHQRGYQGRGWDGNNSNKILKNLDELDKVVASQVPQLRPIIQCLKDFKIVKDSCFGQILLTEYKMAFTVFKNSFLSTQELAQALGKKCSLSWKFHILLCHVQPFVEHHNCGLAKFA